MMLPHVVHITATAFEEIDAYLAWSQQAPMTAARWYERLLKAIESLEAFPEMCPLAPENEWYDGELRQLLFGKRRSAYRILFEIRADRVFVLRVRRAAQQLLSPDDF